jgi:hypothetical protein
MNSKSTLHLNFKRPELTLNSNFSKSYRSIIREFEFDLEILYTCAWIFTAVFIKLENQKQFRLNTSYRAYTLMSHEGSGLSGITPIVKYLLEECTIGPPRTVVDFRMAIRVERGIPNVVCFREWLMAFADGIFSVLCEILGLEIKSLFETRSKVFKKCDTQCYILVLGVSIIDELVPKLRQFLSSQEDGKLPFVWSPSRDPDAFPDSRATAVFLND